MVVSPVTELDWPPYPYKAQNTNPFSIMSRQGERLFFVTCMETREEADQVMAELDQSAGHINGWTTAHIYHNGKPT